MTRWSTALTRAGVREPEMRADYDAQRRVVRRFEPHAYLAARLLLPPRLHAPVVAAVAFMHLTDELIDAGEVDARQEALRAWDGQVTQALGKEKFADYVAAFDYGNEDVSGDRAKDNGLTRSWLSSSLRISPLEQIDFLTRLVGRKLPVSAHAFEMTKAILKEHNLPNGWSVRGKTGAGYSIGADGTPDRKRPFGWFVGWAKKDGRTIVFARLSEFSSPQKMSPGLGTRDDVLEQLPAMLDAL